MEAQIPKVGVGIMIFKDGKVLVAKRKGSHGKGEYSFPGGHLEYMESFEQCARREIREECGIEIQNIRFLCLANITKYNPKHYVHIGLAADWESGEPRVLEPDRNDAWGWYDINNLPEPFFEMAKIQVKAFQTNQIYFDVPVIQPGVYEHYKGQRYEVVDIAKHSETREELVVYKQLYGDGVLWIQPLKMFLEKVEHNNQRVPRFRLVEKSALQ